VSRQSTWQPPRLLTPGETASLLQVSTKTVTRWRQVGRIHSIQPFGPGEFRRYFAEEIEAIARGEQ
jgi:predicted site-specific integrase-resolvase